MSNLNERQNLRKTLATFTARKMDWLNALAADIRLKPIDKLIGFVIIQHVNRNTLKAWPSIRHIRAKAGGVSAPTVKRAIKRLCDTGWLTRERRLRLSASGHPSNVYTVRFKNTAAPNTSSEDSYDGVPLEGVKGSTVIPPQGSSMIPADDDYADLPHFAAALKR